MEPGTPSRLASLAGYVGGIVAVGALVPALPGVPVRSVGFWLSAGCAIIAAMATGRTRAASCFTIALLAGPGLGAAIPVQLAAVLATYGGPGRWGVAGRGRLAHVRIGLGRSDRLPAAATAGAWVAALTASATAVSALAHISSTVDSMWLAVPVGALVVSAAVLGGRFVGRPVRRPGHEVWSTVVLMAPAPLVVTVAGAEPAFVPLLLLAVVPLTWVLAGPAWTDPLTGLPDRRGLAAVLGDRLAAGPGRTALLLVELDRFREVTEALGDPAGDRLLVAAADRLRATVRPVDTVARVDVDRYAVVVPGLPEVRAARRLADRVVTALAEPVVLDGLALDVSALVGVAVQADHGADPAIVTRQARTALAEARRLGSAVALYSAEPDPTARDRLVLLADLRRALASPAGSGLAIYYQPQVALATGEVVGVEALLRWNHPERGPVDPAQLIRVVEPTTVMRLLSGRVVDDVVAQVASWRTHGLVIRASINISSRDLRAELVDRLADRLARFAVPADQLQLELTETAAVTDPRRALATLDGLANLGVALSLDDFGTGYSSLQHLRRFPLAEVKIDRSFVLGMTGEATDATIVRSTVDLGRALGLRVVAEGVEDDQTRRMLHTFGCEVVQGWYYARPMPADEFSGWMTRYRPLPVTPAPATAPLAAP